MGMAASQGRFLGLSARKSNTEYAGQQINQQRTTLSNESANLNNQLLGLSVPTAPSVDSFTKVTYNWKDLNGTTNSINSIVPNTSSTDGSNYWINYSHSETVTEGYRIKDNVNKSYASSAIYRTPSATPTGNFSYAANALALETAYLDNGTANPTISYAYTDITNGTNKTYIGVQDTPLATYSFYEAKLNTKTNAFVADLAAPFGPLQNATINATPQNFTYTFGGVNLTSLANSTDIDKTDKLATLRKQYAAEHNGAVPEDFYYYDDPKNSTDEPVYYAINDLQVGNAWTSDGKNTTATIDKWFVGNNTKAIEEKSQPVYIERDSTGQMKSIKVANHTYELNAATTKDEDGYNDAMNKYEYNQAQYNKQIEDINSKLAIVQTQDRTLEVRLKQLDTEQEAIQTEMDAVKKVIDKNIESTFKTFA